MTPKQHDLVRELRTKASMVSNMHESHPEFKMQIDHLRDLISRYFISSNQDIH